MGLIEDLKNLYNEAQDEVAQRAKQAQQPQGAPASGRPPSIDELRERMRQQKARANAPASRAKAVPAEAPAEPDALRYAARHAERHAAERLAEKEAAKAKAATVSAHERMARLMRQPRTLRDLVILKELLDRPLALRRFPHQR